MTCRCADLGELLGDEARAYANDHLSLVETRADGWELVLRCPETDLMFLRDYPRSEEHGGGPTRLRRLAQSRDIPQR